MRKTVFLIILLLSFSCSMAEEIKNTNELPVYYLEPVIVTATRYPLDLSRIPNHISFLTSDQIKKRNIANLGDILKDLAGLDYRTNGVLGQNSTISLRGSLASQVLVLQDGRSLNSLTYGNFNLTDFPVENIQRVEIVRGPLSSLYGANALGGVINIITKNKLENTLSLNLSHGNFHTQEYCLDFSPKLNDFSLLFAVQSKSTDGDRQNSKFQCLSINSKLTYHPNDRADFQFALKTQKDQIGIPGVVPDPNSVPAYGNRDVYSLYDRQKDFNWSADLDFDFGLREKDRLSVKAYFDRRKLNYHTLYDMWDAYFNTVKTAEDDQYITSVYGGFAQYLFCFDVFESQHNLIWGIDFHQDKLHTKQNIDYQLTGPTSLVDTIVTYTPRTENLAFWTNLNFNMKQIATFQTGLRFDHHSQYSDYTSPNLGLILHLSKHHQLKLSYGQAFRAPTFNDLYWPQGGNKNLKPEKGESFEASLCLSKNQNFFDLTLFRHRVEQLITWAPLGKDNMWQPFNLDKYESWGIEADAKMKLSKYFNLNYNWTINLGEETRNLLVYDDFITQIFEEKKRGAAFTPKVIINLGLEVSTDFGLELALDANYLDKRINYYVDWSDYPNITYKTKTIPASANLDLSINQEIAHKIYLTGKIYNLFDDKKPIRFGNSLTDRDYPNPGRRISSGIRLEI